MKNQDLIAIAVLSLIVIVLGILSLSSLFTTPSERFELSAEPEAIEAGFSQEGRDYLLRTSTRDFSVSVDGVSEPKNQTPFND